MKLSHKNRRTIVVTLVLFVISAVVALNPNSYDTEIVQTATAEPATAAEVAEATSAVSVLAKLEIKGRAPKTGYTREQFYNGWPDIDGCSLRQRIIKRDFGVTAKHDAEDSCIVVAGAYNEPYVGEYVEFSTRAEISKQVQVDHVVALSDAWQKGAQNLDKDARYQIATDPLNLIAADASANMIKGDADAATWLPPNKKFRCQYVARQVSVKYKYRLWVTQAEHDAIKNILETCPNEPAVGV